MVEREAGASSARLIALLALTVSTGIVDAASFLGLGNVFTALMTGNVAFLGFSFVGVEGFSASRSSAALAAFFVGALVVGIVERRTTNAGRTFLVPAGVLEVAGLVLGTALCLAAPVETDGRVVFAIIAAVAFAMGARSATMLRLAEPDLKTNVLTLTLAAFAARTLFQADGGKRRARQLLSVACLMLGAAFGAWLMATWGLAAALGSAALIVIVSFAVLVAGEA